MKNLFKRFEKAMMAVAFAEEGCNEQALELMKETPVSSPKETFESFLSTIGLQNVRMCYGVVRI
jgi:hypothetical protein